MQLRQHFQAIHNRKCFQFNVRSAVHGTERLLHNATKQYNANIGVYTKTSVLCLLVLLLM